MHPFVALLIIVGILVAIPLCMVLMPVLIACVTYFIALAFVIIGIVMLARGSLIGFVPLVIAAVVVIKYSAGESTGGGNSTDTDVGGG